MTVAASTPDRRHRPSVAPPRGVAAPTEPVAGSGPPGRPEGTSGVEESLEGETNPWKELVSRGWQRLRGTRTRRWSKTLESAGSVDRAPRLREARGTRDRRRSLVAWRRGGDPPTDRAERGQRCLRGAGVGRVHAVPGDCPVDGARVAKVVVAGGESRRAGHDPEPRRDHREVTPSRVEPKPGDRRTDTSRRTPRVRVGQPVLARTDGASLPTPASRGAGRTVAAPR